MQIVITTLIVVGTLAGIWVAFFAIFFAWGIIQAIAEINEFAEIAMMALCAMVFGSIVLYHEQIIAFIRQLPIN